MLKGQKKVSIGNEILDMKLPVFSSFRPGRALQGSDERDNLYSEKQDLWVPQAEGR